MTKPQKIRAMTRAEYAKARGISRARVSQLEKAARLVLTLDDLIDVAATDRLLAVETDNRGGHNRGGSAAQEKERDAASRGSAKTRREEAMAQLAEMEVAELAGNLMAKDEVVGMVASACTEIRVHLEALPDQLAPQLAQQDEEHVRAVLAEEIERTLVRLSERFRNLSQQSRSDR